MLKYVLCVLIIASDLVHQRKIRTLMIFPSKCFSGKIKSHFSYKLTVQGCLCVMSRGVARNIEKICVEQDYPLENQVLTLL